MESNSLRLDLIYHVYINVTFPYYNFDCNSVQLDCYLEIIKLTWSEVRILLYVKITDAKHKGWKLYVYVKSCRWIQEMYVTLIIIFCKNDYKNCKNKTRKCYSHNYFMIHRQAYRKSKSIQELFHLYFPTISPSFCLPNILNNSVHQIMPPDGIRLKL